MAQTVGFLTTQRNTSILLGLLLLFLASSMLLSEPVFGDTGLFPFGIVLEDSTNPPPDQPRENILSFTLGNGNQVCDEQLTITKTMFQNDPLSTGDGILPTGSAVFLGFKRNLGDPSYATQLTFELEDESTTKIFMGVQTGEDSNGCDFQGFKVVIRICDIGPKCFTCCDHKDPPGCEESSPYVLDTVITAAALPLLSGTATMAGKVQTSNGFGLGARVTANLPNCVTGAPDNTAEYSGEKNTKKLGDDKGLFSFENIPFGTYTVTARRDGIAQSQTVIVTTNNVQVPPFIF